MAHTHTLGRVYVTYLHYLPPIDRRRNPLLEVGWTQECEPPYRIGTSLVLRVPFTSFAAVLGWWKAVDEELAALFTPLGNDVEQYRQWR